MTKHETKHDAKDGAKHDDKHFKMITTQKGVRHGEIHPVVFQKDKTYALDESLKSQFHELKAIEPSHDAPEEPTAHEDTPDSADNWVAKEPLNENVLDEDPAVLRHAELPVDAIVAQNDAAQAAGDMTEAAKQALGRTDETLAAKVDAQADSQPDAKAEPADKPKAAHKPKHK